MGSKNLVLPKRTVMRAEQRLQLFALREIVRELSEHVVTQIQIPQKQNEHET